MSFVYPLGLLGLIGIPILIIIYIIKNKYTEQTIASVYIWKLSERFLKRKKPISKLQGLINLILQCLTIAAISLLIAQPSIVIKGGARDYCFILDASASMSSEYSSDETRFDHAKSTIKNYINSSNEGSAYNLIYSGSSTQVVFSNITSKSKAISYLDDLKCSSVYQTVDKSIQEAQKLFDNNSNTIVYLITDKEYNVNNIELVNLGDNNVNYAILSSSYRLTEATYNADLTIKEHAKITVTGTIESYNGNGTADVALIVDDEVVSTQSIELVEDTPTAYSFEVQDVASFANYEVRITSDDANKLDNSYKVYNLVLEHNYKALIVSSQPFYFQALLESYGKIEETTTIDYKEYKNGNYTGYGLYIFDTNSCPENLPTDGTIWIWNLKQSITDSGFSYLDTNSSTSGYTLEKETVYGEEKDLISDYIDADSYKMVTQNYNLYSINKNFKTLFSIDSYPVIFTGSTQNQSKNRLIVFGFDIRGTNLAMNYNSLRMFNKMLDYSFPTVVDSNTTVAGEELTYNVVSGVKNIRLYSPSGTATYLSTNSSIGSVILDEVGTYVFEITNSNNVVSRINVYSSFPEKENESSEQELVASITGEQTNEYRNSYYSLVTTFFVILLIIFIADWMVYCYEQHQLF